MISDRKVTWYSRGATIALVALIVGLLVRLGFSAHVPDALPQSPAPYTVGAASVLRDGATIRLALATDCKYCEESALFYRTLLATRSVAKFHAVAVFSEPLTLATAYLHSRNISVDEVKQADLRSLGIVGTPEISILDRDGRVLKTWKGMATAKVQWEIAAALDVLEPFRSAARAADRRMQYDDAERAIPMTTEQLTARLHDGSSLFVVDTRERDTFDKSHIRGALNIPYDELSIRASIEIPRGAKVVLFCQYLADCEEKVRERNALSQCSLAASYIIRAGATEVSLVTAEHKKLIEAGVPMESTTRNSIPLSLVAQSSPRG